MSNPQDRATLTMSVGSIPDAATPEAGLTHCQRKDLRSQPQVNAGGITNEPLGAEPSAPDLAGRDAVEDC
jgi:hypothetical protein